MAGDAPLLLQKPTLSASEIAFVYAGDLWIVGREGGAARRLTSGAGIETNPHFSPDGTEIAFTGEYDGNVDVYVVAAAGGVPRRLTWHPAPDQTAGWSPDGKQLLFSSNRNSYSRFSRLFTVSRNGGMPVELPLPIAAEGSYSADSSRLAYVPLDRAFSLWKRYRGGRASLIWIAALADSSIEKIPRDNSNDFNPMWVGENIYFLSDRNGAVSLFAYDTRKKTVSEILHNDGSQWRVDLSFAVGDCRHPGCDNVKYAGGATSQPNHAATGDEILKLDDMEVRVDPRAEWKQIYHEAFRLERDFFYDPGFHGLNLAATEKQYEPYLDGLGARTDLNYLLKRVWAA
jgi:dipeptidyl aminopeptidase/acylaminoacyl peptidase